MRHALQLALVLTLATACAQEGPGIYDGDPSMSCNEVCAEQLLACDESHVWSTDILGFRNRGGGERRYQRSTFDRTNVLFPCATVPPDSVERDGEIYEGTDTYECACINPAVDAGAVDGGSPDVVVDVPVIALDSTTPDSGALDVSIPDVSAPDAGPTPGTYAGDIDDPSSCEDVCVAVGLSCNARHRWPGDFLVPGDPGGGQANFGGDTTNGFGCYESPPAMFSGSPLRSYRCACVLPRVIEGELLNEVEQSIERTSVYQGRFTVAEPADVSYSVQDNYVSTPNSFDVAIVPSASIDAFLAGEEPLVYGEGSSGSVSLPADEYILAVVCRNAISSCRFHTLVVLD
ncbi:MAG: hypothetical protein AB8H86_26255 [Polyangiales bacterium]